MAGRGAGPVAAKARADEQREFRGDVDQFLAYLRSARGLSPNTVRSYATDLSSYCDWVEREGVRPLGVSHAELRRYLAELSRARYASKTINRHLSALRTLYKWLLSEGYAKTDAAAALSSKKVAKTLPATINDADVRALLATCDLTTAVGMRDDAMLELMYASGARISEVSALDVRDVDFGQKQVRLFGKGSKERIVPLYDAALYAVHRYIGVARGELLAARKGADDGALFLSTRGNRMSADSMRKTFERHAVQAGVSGKVTPHTMRHTFATELLSGGADLKSVQELLGHESLSTTQIYTHLSIDRLKDAARQAHPRAGEGE